MQAEVWVKTKVLLVPLCLKRASRKDCRDHQVLRELGMLGDTQLLSSNTWHNGWNPGMRVWSERTITHKGKPDQIMRMTGKVVGVTSRLIVPNQTSNDPIDTPLVEVQWDGGKSTALLSPSELHVESDEQATDETPALVDKAAVVPEVAEELASESPDPKLEAGFQTILQEVRDMTASVDNTSASAVEVVEELTEEEAAERHRLELKVERAFFEAGKALAELRNKKLYRNTHRSFEEYCQNRFGYTRYSAYYKIAASEVFDNLLTKSQQNSATESNQILPTKETQVRPLAKLEPEEQLKVWQQAVESAGGRVPSERIVKAEVLRHKGIVERLKEKYHIPATDSYNVGDVFWVTGLSGSERKYNGCWAIAIGVNDFTLNVDVHDAVLLVKPDNLSPIDSPDARRQLPNILKRIKRLRQCGLLDRGAYNVLEDLGQQTYLTEVEEKLLSVLENHYGVFDL